MLQAIITVLSNYLHRSQKITALSIFRHNKSLTNHPALATQVVRKTEGADGAEVFVTQFNPGIGAELHAEAGDVGQAVVQVEKIKTAGVPLALKKKLNISYFSVSLPPFYALICLSETADKKAERDAYSE